MFRNCHIFHLPQISPHVPENDEKKTLVFSEGYPNIAFFARVPGELQADGILRRP